MNKPVKSMWIADAALRLLVAWYTNPESVGVEESHQQDARTVVNTATSLADALLADTWAEEPAPAPAARAYEDGYRAGLEWAAGGCKDMGDCMNMTASALSGNAERHSALGAKQALHDIASRIREHAKGGGT